MNDERHEAQGQPQDDAEDIGESEWLRFAASNPAFDFLKEPQEDIYSPNDGKPFHSQCHIRAERDPELPGGEWRNS